MIGGKKWLAVLRDEQYEWLKDTSKEVGLKGSHVIRELIDRAMTEDNKRFKQSLAQTQLKIKLQNLNDKKAAILEEERELKRQMSNDRVAA